MTNHKSKAQQLIDDIRDEKYGWNELLDLLKEMGGTIKGNLIIKLIELTPEDHPGKHDLIEQRLDIATAEEWDIRFVGAETINHVAIAALLVRGWIDEDHEILAALPEIDRHLVNRMVVFFVDNDQQLNNPTP
ncbi:MAG: hypothetical protein AAGK74_17120 [Chloroflexota bacterium]